MALNAPDIEVIMYSDPTGENLYLEEVTGDYSSNNLLGWGLPGGPTTSSITNANVTLNYTQLSSTAAYVFTINNNVITAATLSFAGAAPAVDILSELASTVWPFTSANPFNLTGDYGVTLPVLEDMVFELTYEVIGTYATQDFDYLVEIQELFDWNTYSCISKALANAEMSQINPNEMSKALTAYGYLLTARAQNEDLNTDEANSYQLRAKAVCEGECNCGCN